MQWRISLPAFKVVFFGNAENNISQQLIDVKIKMLTFAFNEIPAFLFGNESNFYILLRPDNHISYIGKDLNKCSEMLHKISYN
jgi:hypothetical protein